MLFFLEKIISLGIDWNERPLTEADFYQLCKRHNVVVEELPLRVSGFYYCVKGGHYIAIDSKLPPQMKLFVMFHEFAHFWMHAPDMGVTANFHGIGRRTRKESEADAFALCAIIPQTRLAIRSINELAEDDGIPIDLLKQRFEILEKHGI